MRLTGMVECLDQLASPDTTSLTTVDVVKMITGRERERRRNSKLTRLRRAADLAQPHADVTDLHVLPDRTSTCVRSTCSTGSPLPNAPGPRSDTGQARQGRSAHPRRMVHQPANRRTGPAPPRADRTPHRRRIHDLLLPDPAREMERPDRGESRCRRHRRPHHCQRPQDDPDLQGLLAQGLQT